MTIKAP